MAAQPAALHEDFTPRLTPFEASFVRTVLEHRGLFSPPSLAEFTRALDVLRRYDEQCVANPGYEDVWAPALGAEASARSAVVAQGANEGRQESTERG